MSYKELEKLVTGLRIRAAKAEVCVVKFIYQPFHQTLSCYKENVKNIERVYYPYLIGF